MDHDRCRSASLILLRMAGLPVKQLNHWNLWMKSRETYTKAHHHCYKSGGNGTRTILGNDINHPIIVRTYTGTCPIRALTLKWTLESTGILRISAQHAPTFFVSRLQERERCGKTWKIDDAVDGQKTSKALSVSDDFWQNMSWSFHDYDVGSSVAPRSTVHYHWSKKRQILYLNNLNTRRSHRNTRFLVHQQHPASYTKFKKILKQFDYLCAQYRVKKNPKSFSKFGPLQTWAWHPSFGKRNHDQMWHGQSWLHYGVTALLLWIPTSGLQSRTGLMTAIERASRRPPPWTPQLQPPRHGLPVANKRRTLATAIDWEMCFSVFFLNNSKTPKWGACSIFTIPKCFWVGDGWGGYYSLALKEECSPL